MIRKLIDGRQRLDDAFLERLAADDAHLGIVLRLPDEVL